MEKTPRSATPVSSPSTCPNPASRPSFCYFLPSPPFKGKKGGANGLVRSLTLGSRAFSGGAVFALDNVSKPISGRIDYDGEYWVEFRVYLFFRVAKVERSPLDSTHLHDFSLSQPSAGGIFFLFECPYNTGNGQPRLENIERGKKSNSGKSLSVVAENVTCIPATIWQM